jgi:AcrR family transcriptional regulator
MFLIEYARHAAFDENVRDLVQARLTAWDAFQITQITDGKERGEIAADVDVDVASLWLGCLYGGLGTLRLVGLVDGEEARRISARRLDAPDIWPRVGCGLGYQPAPTPTDDGAAEEADRRTEILDATLRLMGRVGVHGVHFLDVAAEAGLSDTLPRYYFPTLGDLLAAAFARVEVLEQRTVRRRAAGLADPFDRLRDAYVGELADDPGAMHDRWIAWGELMRLACVDDAMQERVQRWVARWIEEQAPLLAELQSTGRSAPNVPARAVLIPLIATLIGLGTARLLDVTSAERQRRTMLAAIDVELALPRA